MTSQFFPIVIALMLAGPNAHAQAPILTVPSGDDVIETVKKGSVVPFDGQLFNNDTAIRWGLWLKQFQERAQVDLDKQRSLCNAELNFKDRAAAIEADKAAALSSDLLSRLKESEAGRLQAQEALSNPPFYKAATFQFTLGVLSTVAVVLVAHKVF